MLTSDFGMPTPAGAPQVGEEAARKLLGGASPASLSPEELLPAIDALAAAKTTAAADVLSTLSKPKAVAKAARRALFRLQSQGIHPSAKPQESQTVAESDRPAAPRIT